MSVKLSPVFNDQTFDANGNPAVGYKLFTYAAGSSTKQSTYTSSTGGVAHPNPIILNASGYPTTGPIWLTSLQNYKFVLALSTDTDPPTSPVRTIDDIAGVNDTVSSVAQWVASGVTPTYVSATSFTLPGDQTGEFHPGRRVQCTTTGGTVYGAIVTSAYAALTTVTIAVDSTLQLDAGLSAINLSILRNDHLAIPSSALISSFRNKIINGAFRTNSRGYVSGAALATGVPATGVGYGHDCWRGGPAGATYTFTQTNNYTTVTITAGTLITAAEDLDIDSSTMVLSWIGTSQARVGVNGAAPSGAYAASPIQISCTPGQKVSVEFNTGTLGKVQMENSTTPTPMEYPTADMQAARCGRYLPAAEGSYALGQCTSGTAAAFVIQVAPRARVAPTGILASAAALYSLSAANGTGIALATLVFTASGVRSALLSATVAAGLVAGNATFLVIGSNTIYFTGGEL